MHEKTGLFARLAGVAVLASMAVGLSTAPSEAEPFEFRGFYAGGHAGYIDAEADSGSFSLDGDSLMGGFQAGYNFLSGTNIIYGVEIDISLAGTGPSGACNGISGCELDMGPLGTLRARAGYATGDLLFYATGGLAGSQFEFQDSLGHDSDGGLMGWTLGAGVEYLLGDSVGVKNVGVKAEYRYLQFGDFGNMEDEIFDQLGNEVDVDMHVIMLGVNWHF